MPLKEKHTVLNPFKRNTTKHPYCVTLLQEKHTAPPSIIRNMKRATVQGSTTEAACCSSATRQPPPMSLRTGRCHFDATRDARSVFSYDISVKNNSYHIRKQKRMEKMKRMKIRRRRRRSMRRRRRGKL